MNISLIILSWMYLPLSHYEMSLEYVFLHNITWNKYINCVMCFRQWMKSRVTLDLMLQLLQWIRLGGGPYELIVARMSLPHTLACTSWQVSLTLCQEQAQEACKTFKAHVASTLQTLRWMHRQSAVVRSPRATFHAHVAHSRCKYSAIRTCSLQHAPSNTSTLQAPSCKHFATCITSHTLWSTQHALCSDFSWLLTATINRPDNSSGSRF